MLRAYNAEADTCVRTLRDGILPTAEQRLEKAALTIARLGQVIRASPCSLMGWVCADGCCCWLSVSRWTGRRPPVPPDASPIGS